MKERYAKGERVVLLREDEDAVIPGSESLVWEDREAAGVEVIVRHECGYVFMSGGVPYDATPGVRLLVPRARVMPDRRGR